MDENLVAKAGPFVGWTVHFYPGEEDGLPQGPIAAIITKVWSGGTVNLTIFPSSEPSAFFTSVLYNHKPDKYRRWCYISDTFKQELNG